MWWVLTAVKQIFVVPHYLYIGLGLTGGGMHSTESHSICVKSL